MAHISHQATKLPSADFADLCVKARIWLERAIPEEGDDVAALAMSICTDLLAFADKLPAARHEGSSAEPQPKPGQRPNRTK